MENINDNLNLSLAIDIINFKIAEILRKQNIASNQKEKDELELEFKKLVCEKELIYERNEKVINKVIKEARSVKND